MPEIEKIPIYIKINVTGNFEYRPPIFLISLLWPNKRVIEPADKKSSALKKEKLTKWKIATLYAEIPTAKIIKPIWEHEA